MKSLQKLQRNLQLSTFFFNSPRLESMIPPVNNNTWSPPLTDPNFIQMNNIILNYIQESKTSLSQIPITTVLSKNEKLLLDTIRSLKTMDDLIIKPADKNLGTCIMKTSTYNNLCNKILEDNTTYQQLTTEEVNNRLPFEKLKEILSTHQVLFEQKHRRNLWENNGIPLNPTKKHSKLATSLLQMENNSDWKPFASFYILPKMHKSTISGRPIVNCINTSTYHTSKYLHNLFHPIVLQLPTITLSSTDTLIKLSYIKSLPSSAVILCADIKNLYPSIKTKDGINRISKVLRRFNSPDLKLTLALLEFVLSNNYLSFHNKTYLQKDGTAMGTPLAPSYANLVLFDLEIDLVNHSNPIIYQRYIDDLFIIFKDKDSAENFLTKFQTLDPNIQLDAITIDKRGIFLDMEIEIVQDQIHTKTYQKPINKYLYLPPTSNHQEKTFTNIIQNELRRYYILSSSLKDYYHMRSQFFIRLQNRGYSTHFLKKTFSIDFLPRSELLNSIDKKRKCKMTTNNNKPVFIINFPVNKQIKKRISTALSFPDSLLKHPMYKKAYPTCHDRKIPIMAIKYGSNLNHLLTVDSTRRTLSISEEHSSIPRNET